MPSDSMYSDIQKDGMMGDDRDAEEQSQDYCRCSKGRTKLNRFALLCSVIAVLLVMVFSYSFATNLRNAVNDADKERYAESQDVQGIHSTNGESGHNNFRHGRENEIESVNLLHKRVTWPSCPRRRAVWASLKFVGNTLGMATDWTNMLLTWDDSMKYCQDWGDSNANKAKCTTWAVGNVIVTGTFAYGAATAVYELVNGNVQTRDTLESQIDAIMNKWAEDSKLAVAKLVTLSRRNNATAAQADNGVRVYKLAVDDKTVYAEIDMVTGVTAFSDSLSTDVKSAGTSDGSSERSVDKRASMPVNTHYRDGVRVLCTVVGRNRGDIAMGRPYSDVWGDITGNIGCVLDKGNYGGHKVLSGQLSNSRDQALAGYACVATRNTLPRGALDWLFSAAGSATPQVYNDCVGPTCW